MSKTKNKGTKRNINRVKDALENNGGSIPAGGVPTDQVKPFPPPERFELSEVQMLRLKNSRLEMKAAYVQVEAASADFERAKSLDRKVTKEIYKEHGVPNDPNLQYQINLEDGTAVLQVEPEEGG